MGDTEAGLIVEFFASKKLMNTFGVFQIAGYEDVITDIQIGINLFPLSVLYGDDENIINSLISTIAHEYLHMEIWKADPESANDEYLEGHEEIVSEIVYEFCPEVEYKVMRYLRFVEMWEELEMEAFVAYV